MTLQVSSSYTIIEQTLRYPGYTAPAVLGPITADFDLDGFQDLLVLGASYPGFVASPVAQAAGLLLGNGSGLFTPAAASVFPAAALLTVHPRKVLVEDFNGDGRPDLFIASHGWDTAPFPGEQNRLILSQGTGWVDATGRLPALSDFTHTAAAGDVDGDGDIDVFVGNGYAGQNGIFSYLLVNDGAGGFTLDRGSVPVASGEVLDFHTMHMFPGATLADLDADGRPDLIVTADASMPSNALRESVVLWNQGGRFTDAASTKLPATTLLPNQIVTDARAMDINADGIQDLVVTGTQGQPFYDGWFVQVLQGLGNHRFADVTDQVIADGMRMGGTPGAGAGQPWGMWVQPLDFNRDGHIDFAIEYNGASTPKANTPLVWLNDGTGHFSTITAGEVVAADQLWRLGYNHWYESDRGYSVVATQLFPGSNGLMVGGVLATAAVTATPDSGLARTGGAGNDRVRGGDGNDAIDGGAGRDTAVYFGKAADYQLTRSAGGFTVKALAGRDGTDTLTGVERIDFLDRDLALDLDGGAGQVARILGAVFGREAVGNADYAGIGLRLLDGGMGADDLMQLAIDARLGPGASHGAVVDLLYTNVMGTAPSATERAFYQGWLDRGETSVPELGWLAANLELNAIHIGLAGLQQTGLAYTG